VIDADLLFDAAVILRKNIHVAPAMRDCGAAGPVFRYLEGQHIGAIQRAARDLKSARATLEEARDELRHVVKCVCGDDGGDLATTSGQMAKKIDRLLATMTKQDASDDAETD